MKKLLYILGGVFSALSLSGSFPLMPCAFNRYEEVSQACLHSKYLSLAFGIIGLVAAIKLLYLSRNSANMQMAPTDGHMIDKDVADKRIYVFKWLLIVSLIMQLGIMWRTFAYTEGREQVTDSNPIESATTTATSTPDSNQATVSNKLTLKLGEKTLYDGRTIRADAVLEDSRCASDVTCIWAGRAKASIAVDDEGAEFEIGQSRTLGGLQVTLSDILPYPKSTHKTTDGEYRIVLTITR
jgi:hypothetical protein